MNVEEIKRVIIRYTKVVKRKLNSMSREQRRLYSIMLTSLAIGSLLGGAIGAGLANGKAEKAKAAIRKEMGEDSAKREAQLQEQIDKLQAEKADALKQEETELPWNMVLVNYENPMEEGYVPELKELTPGYQVDVRIYDAAKKMLSDAKAAGLNVVVRSAYRSVATQKYVFNESVTDRLAQGMDYWEAFEDTRLSVAEPGTSEHALGLALDLVSSTYTELDEKQEETAEAKWLAENCYKYGFILRYPPEKTDITGIIYEPWHYRYVGVEDATKIMALNITLEEYLENHYQK